MQIAHANLIAKRLQRTIDDLPKQLKLLADETSADQNADCAHAINSCDFQALPNRLLLVIDRLRPRPVHDKK
jgi:hypothetical protein